MCRVEEHHRESRTAYRTNLLCAGPGYSYAILCRVRRLRGCTHQGRLTRDPNLRDGGLFPNAAEALNEINDLQMIPGSDICELLEPFGIAVKNRLRVWNQAADNRFYHRLRACFEIEA